MYSLLHHSKIYLVTAPATANRRINIMLFWTCQQTNIRNICNEPVTSRYLMHATQKGRKVFLYTQYRICYIPLTYNIRITVASFHECNWNKWFVRFVAKKCEIDPFRGRVQFEDQLRIKWLFFGIQTRSFANKSLIIRLSGRDRLSLHVRFTSDAMFKRLFYKWKMDCTHVLSKNKASGT